MSCLNCSKETTNPKFCSKSCAVSHNNKTTKTKKEKTYCKYCQKELVKRNRTGQIFCDVECRKLDTYNKFLLGQITDASSIRRIIKQYYEQKCSICGITEWCNKPLILIVDHIDGNPSHNHPTNLRLVCSNCDSQLPTYKAKNKNGGRHKRNLRYKNKQSY